MKNLSIKLISIVILFSTLMACGKSRAQEEVSENKSGNSQSADSSYVVDVKALDYAFAMPTEIPSGWVTFRMKNMGREEHLGILIKLPDSLSSLAIASAQKRFRKHTLPLGEYKAGPGILSPGRTGETTVYLEPGMYVLECTVKTPEGEPHLDKGMYRSFRVTDQLGKEEKPDADIGITVSRYAYSTDLPIGPRTHTFDVQFAEDGVFDVFIVRLKANQDIEDVFDRRLQAPSPFEHLGGTEQRPGLFKVSLEPGRYGFYSTQGGPAGLYEEFVIPKEGKAPALSSEPVNPPVTLSLSSNDSVFTVPAGRTLITFKNEGKNEIDYLLFRLKQGFTEAQFYNHIQPAALYSRNKSSEFESVPINLVKYGIRITPGGRREANYHLRKGTYFLVPYVREHWVPTRMLDAGESRALTDAEMDLIKKIVVQ